MEVGEREGREGEGKKGGEGSLLTVMMCILFGPAIGKFLDSFLLTKNSLMVPIGSSFPHSNF